MWHLNSFRFRPKKRGRSKLAEEKREVRCDQCLLVMICIEKEDEDRLEGVVDASVKEVEKVSRNIGVNSIVLHSFTHLFCNPSDEGFALKVLDVLLERLRSDGFDVLRTPFGWFGELEIMAKGHPLSRVARRF